MKVCEQALAILGADRMALSDPRDARVPGSGVHLLDHRALRELPGKRVLPPAGADDEDSHAAKPNAGSRRLKDPFPVVS